MSNLENEINVDEDKEVDSFDDEPKFIVYSDDQLNEELRKHRLCYETFLKNKNCINYIAVLGLYSNLIGLYYNKFEDCLRRKQKADEYRQKFLNILNNTAKFEELGKDIKGTERWIGDLENARLAFESMFKAKYE